MFDRLRRAKSFIQKTKREEKEPETADLDLSESSHLRRNISIDSEVLNRQKVLNRSEKPKKLLREVSRSQEHLHDAVLEQLRRINFGDSYSKKNDKELRESANLSEKNYHRRSVGNEANTQKSHPRTSGDVISVFTRNKAAYRSERIGVKKKENALEIGSSDDFLLNRKTIDMNYKVNRNPPYMPTLQKPHTEKNGFKGVLQKIKNMTKLNEHKDVSDSGCSTTSSTRSFSYEPGPHGSQNLNSGSCSNTSTASSVGSGGFERHAIQYQSERRFDIIKSTDQQPFIRNKLYSSQRNFVSKNHNSNSIFDANHSSYYSKDNYAQTQEETSVVPVKLSNGSTRIQSRKRQHY